ncbi:MAG: hypothetical protein HY721_07670 [Planctomycetes bacterium]|nr:hypothetical protein [Planctomycetota bacterium]
MPSQAATRSLEAIEELQELETCIRGNLSRYYGSEERRESPLVGAMKEIHAVLAQGLRALESRRLVPARDLVDEPPPAPPPRPRRDPSVSDVPRPAPDELCLEYETELQCLAVLGLLEEGQAPARLRRARSRPAGGTASRGRRSPEEDPETEFAP